MALNESIYIKSAFDIYNYTKDKQDLVENLIVIYNVNYQKIITNTVKNISLQLNLEKK